MHFRAFKIQTISHFNGSTFQYVIHYNIFSIKQQWKWDEWIKSQRGVSCYLVYWTQIKYLPNVIPAHIKQKYNFLKKKKFF